MCKILLSIKPEHVENIMNKRKLYEFRKIKCKEKVEQIVIYATAPVSKVVAEVEVVEVIEDIPEEVWKITEKFSGISKEYFEKYYQNKNKAVAYKLGFVKPFRKPKQLIEFGVTTAPQSFVYL